MPDENASRHQTKKEVWLYERIIRKNEMLNQLIQRQAAELLDFDDVAKVIAHNIGANTYIISQEGHLLGYSLDKVKICDIMIELLNEGRVFPQAYNEELNEAEETKVNIPRNGKCAFRPGHICHMGNSLQLSFLLLAVESVLVPWYCPSLVNFMMRI